MPAPLLAGLGAKGVSELVAIGAIVASTGTTVATLPDAYVTIGSISLSLASAGTIYVGDRFILTGHVEVSYGEVSAGEGSIKVEIIEQGKGVLKSKVINGQAPKERVTIRLVGQTISHGKKFYYLRATPTGEEDLSYWPTGDTVVTKPPTTSNALAIDVQKPLSFTTKLLTASVHHGQQARALMKVTNHSESRALLLAKLATSRDNLNGPNRYLQPLTSNLIIIDHSGAHAGDDHGDEQTFYFEPIQHFFHRHHIKHGNLPFVSYDQLKPAKKKTFDPLAITCKGRQANRRVGYLPGHSFPAIDQGEYAYACYVWDENEGGLPATASLQDGYGNVLTGESDANGYLALQGELLGQVATLTIQPLDEQYAPYSERLPLNAAFLADSDNAFVFHPRPLPPVEGVVLLPEAGKRIPGATVQLLNGLEEVVAETVTGTESTFTFSITADLFRHGSARIRARLPWNLTFHWLDPEPTVELTRAAVESGGTPVVIKAGLHPAEDWITISGLTGFKDFASRKFIPTGGLELVVRTETQQIVDTSTSSDTGSFSFSVAPGIYLLEVINAEDLGYRPVPPAVVELRSSRKDLHLILRYPYPQTEPVTPSIRWWDGGSGAEDTLALLVGGEVVREVQSGEEGAYLDLREMTGEKHVRWAIKRGDYLGPSRAPDPEEY